MLMTLIVIGVILYLVTLLPLDPTIQLLIRVLVIIFAILWLLQLFAGGGSGFGHLRLTP
jgi:ABC-type glucose/galactose transport system permease subunit